MSETAGKDIRCVCGKSNDSTSALIQCDSCRIHQHQLCVGILEGSVVPEVYLCDQCDPDGHFNGLLTRRSKRKVLESVTVSEKSQPAKKNRQSDAEDVQMSPRRSGRAAPLSSTTTTTRKSASQSSASSNKSARSAPATSTGRQTRSRKMSLTSNHSDSSFYEPTESDILEEGSKKTAEPQPAASRSRRSTTPMKVNTNPSRTTRLTVEIQERESSTERSSRSRTPISRVNREESAGPSVDGKSSSSDVEETADHNSTPTWSWQVHHCRQLMSALHRLAQMHCSVGRTALQAHSSGLLNALNDATNLVSPLHPDEQTLVSPLQTPTDSGVLQDMHSLRKELSDWYDRYGHRKLRT